MKNVEVARAVIATPAGRVGVYATRSGVCRIVLGERSSGDTGKSNVLARTRMELERYFKGENVQFRVPLDMRDATRFRVKVWTELMGVDYGTTVSYRELAELCGKPNSWRAIAGAVAANPLPIIVPCHRVISSDGSLGGFAGGLKWKKFLLKLEGAL